MADDSFEKQASQAPHSPGRLFLIVALSIMAAEIAVMFLFGVLPAMPAALRNILDGVLLTVLLFPVLYFFMFHPIRRHREDLHRAAGQAAVRHSPALLLSCVAVSIMLAETGIMFLFGQLPPMPPLLENVVDGILLMVLLLPILYLFLFRPLRGQVIALGEAEKSLEQQNAELREKTRLLVEAQEELLHRERLMVLGQVADTVGHELRNPLGVMNNAVYYLQAVLTDADETTKEYLGIIKGEIGEAERIVSDLLDAVRTKPPHPEAVDLADAIGQTLRKCDIPASVKVGVDIPATLPPVRVDRMHLHQVLWNLIANAVEAMPRGGELSIRAPGSPEEGSVAISVRDTGTGIAPEHRARLFQPLFTTKARRVGLGLAVVQNLAQANGGSVSVQSEPGKGSNFTVTLPVAD